MTEELKNAGYTIIERFTVGEHGFALGHSETAPAPYVTWMASSPQSVIILIYFSRVFLPSL